MDQITALEKIEDARVHLEAAIADLKAGKPKDRSELDRRSQIIITDLEKLLAVYKDFLING